MLAGLSTILLIKLIAGFGVPSLLLFLYGYKKDAIELRDPALRITITYMIIAFAIFMAIKALHHLKRKAAEAPSAPPAPSTEELLLTEIRDLRKEQKGS